MPLAKAFRSRVRFTVEVLLVGGGGCGGDARSTGGAGGGGGAGEVIQTSVIVEALKTFPIVVGLGWSTAHFPARSTASTALGLTARPGEQGGAPNGGSSGAQFPGNGGNAQGGGGGAGAGGMAPQTPAGRYDGGPGVASSITGVTVVYGGGGGAGKVDGDPVGGAGGSGVGGAGAGYSNGSTNPTTQGSAGGGSAGGASLTFGAVGLVVIRYAGSAQRATGGAITQIPGYMVHTFAVDGTFSTV